MQSAKAAITSNLTDTIRVKKKKYRGYTICQICGLRTFREDGQKRMFMARFPKDVVKAKKWVQVTGKEDLAYIPLKKLRGKFVCGYHFRPDDFKPGQTRLHYGAVPSVWLKCKPLPDYMLENFPFQIAQDDPATASPTRSCISHDLSIIELQDHNYCCTKKKKVKTRPVPISSMDFSIKNTACDNSTNVMEDSLIKIEYETHEDVITPEKNPLKERNKSEAKRKRKENFLSQDPEKLKVNKLRRKWFSRRNVFTIGSGLYPTVMSNLKQIAEKTVEEGKKTCVLLFDEIKIKEHLFYNYFMGKVVGYVDFGDAGGRKKEVADRALVFMLRHVFNTRAKPFIKQPIAHYFYKSEISPEVLSNILKTIIKSVGEAGYKVLASVCVDRQSHVDALNLLKGTNVDSEDLNYYFVEDEKVHIIYDVPHLFMSMRNNLMQYGMLVMDNKVLKWSHLNMAEEKNKSTYKFFKLESQDNEVVNSRQGIKLAIKQLSNTMAAILKLLSESMEDKIDEEMFQAGEVVEMLDKLFDLTNGPTYMNDVKKHRQFVSKNSIHHCLWEEYKRILNNSYFSLETFNCLNDVKCIKSFITTIASLQDIWNYIDGKGFNYISLRKFNLDGMYNVFRNCMEDELFIDNMTSCDIESALGSYTPERLNNSLNKNHVNEIEAFYHYLKRLSVAYESDSYLELLFARFDNHPIVYMSAYVASIMIQTESCQKCCSVLKAIVLEKKSIGNYNLLVDLWKERMPMVYPTPRLCLTVLKAVKVFEREVTPVLYLKNIFSYSVILMSNKCDVSWMCNQHRSTMSKKLFQHLSYLLLRNSCRLLNENLNKQNKTEETKSNLDGSA